MFLVLAGLFLGTLGMLNILGLTRFLQLGSIGSWPVLGRWCSSLSDPFLCTDLINELWGEQKPTKWCGWGCCNGWVLLILWLGLFPALAGNDESTFRTIQQLSFRWRLDGGLSDSTVC